ncbi:hypothetical protein [Agreia bicolorata]|nr:hypothetical protein [Agreia bicolorata]
MTIDPSQFGPYLSLGLLEARSANRSVATLLAEIRNAVFSGRPSSEQRKPRTVHAVGKFTFASIEGRGFVYRVRDTPSWWRGPAISTPTGARRNSPIFDDVLHLILVMKRERSIAVYTSHPSDWGRIVRGIDEGTLAKVNPMPADLINGAFTRSTWAMPTVWMKGLHHPVQTKADSKQLTGLNVRSVIDQFGDQTYHFSSGRSRVPLGNDEYEPTGLSPSKHRIWLGQSADFADFCKRTEWALKALKGVSAIAAPIAELAQPLESLDELKLPDEIGWEAQGERDSWTSEAADALAVLDRVSFDLDSTDLKIVKDGGTGDRTVHAVVHLLNQGAVIADVRLEIRYPKASNTVALKVVPAAPSAGLDEYEQAVETILVDEGWGKIRYSDGHMVSGKVAYLPHYSAVPFTGWEWVDFSTPRAVDVTKEKPIRRGATDRRAVNLSRIGEVGDDSLFSWVYDRWGKGRLGFLLCDDGGGEIADFLHLAPPDADGESLLTFIHAKGGKSEDPNRSLSASAYEVVIAQAIKNLAYVESDAIAAKLLALSATARVWVDGVSGSDASGFASQLLSRGRKMRRRVVVLHPHTVRGQYETDTEAATPTAKGRHAQLSTLLLEAEATCRSVGAQFSVIGAAR